MDQLKLSFLGTFTVIRNREAVLDFESNKVRALLIYLAVERTQHERSTLAMLLWPDYGEANARTNLRQVLYQLRRAIDDKGGSPPYLLINRQTIGLHPAAPCTTDVITFRELIAAVTTHRHSEPTLCPRCLDRLQQAVALYHNDFLTGFALDDSDAFEEWRRITQEQLHLQMLIALHQLTEAAMAQRDDATALRYAQRQLALEPWREEAHRQVMRLLAQSGQQIAALSHYQRCRQLLRRELNIEPDEKTTTLYAQIRAGEFGQAGGQQSAALTHAQAISNPDTLFNAAPAHLAPQGARAEVTAATAPSASLVPALSTPASPIRDWSEMPVVSHLHGRAAELADLADRMGQGACRLVVVLGVGGAGKTTLAAKLARQVAEQFEVVIWRSLLNAPPLAEIMLDWLQTLSHQQITELPASLDQQLRLLLGYLHAQRCLLVLDNAESILAVGAAGEAVGNVRTGYEGYAQLIERLGSSDHRSCLLLTSREQPQALARLVGQPVLHLLYLAGLDAPAGQQLLAQHGVYAPPAKVDALVAHYSGNPLALQIVASTIVDLFGGDIDAFQREDASIFDNIRVVLDQQFARLSALERDLLFWLAIEREAVTVQTLRANLIEAVASRDLMAALRALQRRSLLETSGDGVTLQNVVIEYLTERLVDVVCHEVLDTPWETAGADAPGPIAPGPIAPGPTTTGPIATMIGAALLNRHALVKADAKEYVRQSQVRLILQPVATRLLARLGRGALPAKFAALLRLLQREAPHLPGYIAGNLLNLLLQLEVDLTDYDFSGLSVWQANLRRIRTPRINFAGADLSRSRFAESFGFIYTVVVTPDCALIAAATGDGEVRIWRFNDGTLLHVLRGHQGMVRSLALAPDGQTLVSGGDDFTLRIWQIGLDQAISTLVGHTSHVMSVAISPDGQRIASASADQSIRLWSLATGEQLAMLTGHTGWARAVAFSPDGNYIASGSYDQSVRLWNAKDGTLVTVLRGHTGIVTAVTFHPDCNVLASAATDGTVRLWDLCATTSYTLRGHGGDFWSVAFSPDGTLLAGGANSKLYLWAMAADEQLGQCLLPPTLTQVLVGHTNAIQGLAFTPDSRCLVSGSGDQTLRLWDVQTGEIAQVLQGHSRAVQRVVFSPDGTTLAASSTDRLIWLWDLASGQMRRTLAGHTQSIEALAISPDGALLASGSADGSLRLWPLRDQLPPAIANVRLLASDGIEVSAVDFQADGSRLVSASQDQISLWDPQSGHLRQRFTTGDEVHAAVFHPQLPLLATGHSDNVVRLWDLTTGTLVDTLVGHTGIVWSLAFSPDGTLLASGSFDCTVRLWQITSPRPSRVLATLCGHTGRVFGVAFSPDGTFLVSGGSDRLVCVWDVETQQLRRRYLGHEHWIWTVAVTPDSRTIASGSIDETIRLWDSATGTALATLRAPGPYTGLNIRGATGISAAQRAALIALGAVETP